MPGVSAGRDAVPPMAEPERELVVRRIGIALAGYQPNVGFFREQLASLLAQTFADWICLVSFDSPLAALRDEPQLQPYFQDARFEWRENSQRLGYARNFELGIQALAAQGVDAIACCDQDDVWRPEKLARCAKALEHAGPLSLVHSDMWILPEGKPCTETAWAAEHRSTDAVTPAQILAGNVVSGCSMLFDAELARRFPLPSRGVEHHDQWYAVCAAFHGGVHPIDEPLLSYRQHGGNTIGFVRRGGPFALPRELRPAPAETTQRGGVAYRRAEWRKVEALARAALQAGLPLDPTQQRAFLSPRDRGRTLFTLGLRQLARDPMLALVYWSRSLGKLLSPPTDPRP